MRDAGKGVEFDQRSARFRELGERFLVVNDSQQQRAARAVRYVCKGHTATSDCREFASMLPTRAPQVHAVRTHSHLRRLATRRWRSETCRRMGKDSKMCFFPAEQQHGHTRTHTRMHTHTHTHSSPMRPEAHPVQTQRAHLVKVHVLDLDLIVHRVSHLEHTPRPAAALHTAWSSRKQERLGQPRLSYSGKQERTTPFRTPSRLPHTRRPPGVTKKSQKSRVAPSESLGKDAHVHPRRSVRPGTSAALFHANRLPRGCAVPAAFPRVPAARVRWVHARARSRGSRASSRGGSLPCLAGSPVRAQYGGRAHLCRGIATRCARPLCRGPRARDFVRLHRATARGSFAPVSR